METQLKIQGMHCGHCVRAVKNALEDLKLPGVSVADVGVGHATLQSSTEPPQELIARCLADEGFTLESAQTTQ